jgi:hypothetical protein
MRGRRYMCKACDTVASLTGSPAPPDVPTLDEYALKSFELSAWLAALKRTPREIIIKPQRGDHSSVEIERDAQSSALQMNLWQLAVRRRNALPSYGANAGVWRQRSQYQVGRSTSRRNLVCYTHVRPPAASLRRHAIDQKSVLTSQESRS